MSSLRDRSDDISLPTLRVVGLMSGTSLDGCDAVLVELSPLERSVKIKILDFITHPMPPELRQRIVSQLHPETSRIDELSRLDAALGAWFVDSVEALLTHAGISRNEVDLIGSHGQTMWHEVNGPAEKTTWQLGDGSFISARTGITTVCDFRTADVALGGQGAPLMPFFDNLIYGGQEQTVALQNIGGIGNVTLLPARSLSTDYKVLGFDTGPGNMIIDRFAEKLSDGKVLYDVNGAFAAAGTVNAALLSKWMDHSYFHQPPPKSTGREQFGHAYADIAWEEAMAAGLSPEDAIATATAFTAQSIALSYSQAKQTTGLSPDKVIVSGGGANNPTLMRMLQELLAPAVVMRAGAEGVDADSKEAVAFAVFAYQAVCGRSNHLPTTTGASHEVILGKICPGNNFRKVVLHGMAHQFSSGAAVSDVSATETRHLRSMHLDDMSLEDVSELMSHEDIHVAQVVSSLKKEIVEVAEGIARCIKNSGRVFYIGAGTSGRLGVLDASEIPPTFSAPPDWFNGVIAGGDGALRRAVEGAEDDRAQGERDLIDKGITDRDIVIGIATSGTTPYVHGALEGAKKVGCITVLLSCNHLATRYTYIDHLLTAVVGPEVLTGSTRMKAGTATKLILNQLSTLAMVAMGKTLGNLMVDLRVSNQKLRTRALRILRTVTDITQEDDAVQLLKAAGGSVKLAIAMHLTGRDKETAERALLRHEGRLGSLIQEIKNSSQQQVQSQR